MSARTFAQAPAANAGVERGQLGRQTWLPAQKEPARSSLRVTPPDAADEREAARLSSLALSPGPHQVLQTLLPRDEIAGAIRLDAFRARRVVRHGPGDVVAVCDETGNVTTLQRPQYVQFELSGARLARAIALALGVELNICPLAGCRFAWWLGQLSDSRGASRRVALVADSDNAAATRSLHAATASATARLAAEIFMTASLLEFRAQSNGSPRLSRQAWLSIVPVSPPTRPRSRARRPRPAPFPPRRGRGGSARRGRGRRARRQASRRDDGPRPRRARGGR